MDGNPLEGSLIFCAICAARLLFITFHTFYIESLLKVIHTAKFSQVRILNCKINCNALYNTWQIFLVGEMCMCTHFFGSRSFSHVLCLYQQAVFSHFRYERILATVAVNKS